MTQPFDWNAFDLGAFSGGYDPMKVSDMLTATLKLLGVIAKNETPTADEMADAFSRLNDMLDAWQADRLMIYQVARSVFTCVTGQQAYTIGLAGATDFQIARPIYIQSAGIISTNVNPSFELPVVLLDDDEWAGIAIKSTQAALSWYLYYDNAYPNGTINLWPVPSVTTLQLALYMPTPVVQFPDVNTTVSLPPGYAEAVRYNLAFRLAPEFGVPVDPVVAQLAMQSKRMVELANSKLRTLDADPTLTGGGGRTSWNWILGR